MPDTLKQLITDTAKTLFDNETTRIVNGLLHQNAALQPLLADDHDNAEIVAGVMSLAQGPAKVLGGAFMMVGGIFLSAVPRTVLSVDTVEVLFQEEDAPESAAKVRTEIADFDFANRPGRTPFHYTRTGEIKTFDGDALVKKINVDQSVITRPRIPLIDAPEPVMDYSKHPKPVAYAKAKTSVTGYGLFSTGLGAVVSGALDPLKGLSKSAYLGTKKLVTHLQQKEAEPTDTETNKLKRS